MITEKHLENIYKEEFIRAKARNDYKKSWTKAEKPTHSPIKYALACLYILLGLVSIYALNLIYITFM